MQTRPRLQKTTLVKDERFRDPPIGFNENSDERSGSREKIRRIGLQGLPAEGEEQWQARAGQSIVTKCCLRPRLPKRPGSLTTAEC